MKLILVRHGETHANVNRINQGINHGKLTKNGVLQAKKTADFLAGEEIDFIYSSDLKRAKDTLGEILKKVSAPVEYEKALRERNLGIFEGMPYGSLKNYCAERGLDVIAYRPKGGESIREADKRVQEFYKTCLKKHSGDTLLWVSHGTILKRMLIHALQKDAIKFKDLHPDNCAVSIVEVDSAGKPKVTLVNYIGHLQEKDSRQKRASRKDTES